MTEKKSIEMPMRIGLFSQPKHKRENKNVKRAKVSFPPKVLTVYKHDSSSNYIRLSLRNSSTCVKHMSKFRASITFVHLWDMSESIWVMGCLILTLSGNYRIDGDSMRSLIKKLKKIMTMVLTIIMKRH